LASRLLSGGFAALSLMLVLMSGEAQASATVPQAGASISNQATAEYYENGVTTGPKKSATSNIVQTIVSAVGNFALDAPNTKQGDAGNTVYMPHVLANLGNSSDSFTLSYVPHTGSSLELVGNPIFYPDTNQDGLPDTGASPLVLTNPISLGIDQKFYFVVALTLPNTVTTGSSDTVDVKATASNTGIYVSGTDVKTNLDTVNAFVGPVFQVVKSIDQSQGTASGTRTYTLQYSNIGSATGNIVLHDVIGNLADDNTQGFEYVLNSACSSIPPSAPKWP
jgi:hypothetical protein